MRRILNLLPWKFRKESDEQDTKRTKDGTEYQPLIRLASTLIGHPMTKPTKDKHPTQHGNHNNRGYAHNNIISVGVAAKAS